MKIKIVFAIIICLIIHPLLGLSSMIDLEGDSSFKANLHIAKSFTISHHMAALSKIIMESIADEASAPIPLEQKTSKKSSKSKSDLSMPGITNSSLRNSSNLSWSSANLVKCNITAYTSGIIDFQILQRLRYLLGVFLLFLILFYLLPRGAIDYSFILNLNRGV
ncbi:MAG: hypothetical protein JW871_07655 [Endomicrobiales bacterium]|nr:hypothetical protein [Endomicrobiales bacterium]